MEPWTIEPKDVAYLVTGVLFILGLKYLSSPASARFGNRVAMVGMAVALIAACVELRSLDDSPNWILVLAGVVIGAAVGAISARAVKMTAMPQMVALFNGAGGGAAALVATAEYLHKFHSVEGITAGDGFTSIITAVIGSLSIAGSVIAFLKLQEVMTGRPITYPGQQVVNALVLLVVLAGVGAVTLGFKAPMSFCLGGAGALLLGVLFVLPIGGADMPVVISLLNAFTGLATALTGFVLGNDVLVISGALVGASGTLLTILMGKAMNRPLTNVLFGAFGAVTESAAAAGGGGSANVRSASVDDVATMLAYAHQVIIVPGYGMAVAQAQHAVKDLADQLEAHDVIVKYAIHPVAGRMPGHMNVLLAEADVPYPALFDMEDINPEFSHTDVALIIGANDVTNPAARNDTTSPIYGMPILDVDKAQNVVVLKRSMRSGFAGIPNPLYEDPKTVMLFGDAKESVTQLAATVKTL
jgi:NAD(P) transhydrogenase subunit beta